MQEPIYSILVLVARICLGAIFLVSGVHKALWYSKAIEEFKKASIPVIPLSLPLVIVLHIGASICLIGGMFVTTAALLLAIFMLITTLKMFPFWKSTGTARLDQSRMAMANLAVIGGLLLLAANGPGQLAIY